MSCIAKGQLSPAVVNASGLTRSAALLAPILFLHFIKMFRDLLELFSITLEL